MKTYGHTALAKFLKLTLNLLIVVGAIVFIFILVNSLSSREMQNFSFQIVVTCLLFIAGGIALLSIMYYLRRIIDTLIKVTPFVWDNVKSLKRIAAACFIVAGCYFIIFFVNAQYRDFKFVTIDIRGVHTDIEFLIFFFAGCFIMVLAQVFKQAVEVKEENDFTV
jgi:hypothetical protein